MVQELAPGVKDISFQRDDNSIFFISSVIRLLGSIEDFPF